MTFVVGPAKGVFSASALSGLPARIKKRWNISFALYQNMDARILGPAPAGVLRVNDRYRYRVMLSCRPSGEARKLVAAALRQYSADKRYRNLVLYGDVDPLE